VSDLEPAQVNVLMRWVLELLGRYTASGLFRASLRTVQSLAADRQAEQVKDLRAVLQLLVHLTQRDVVDALDGGLGGGPGGGGGGEQVVDVAQVGRYRGPWLRAGRGCVRVWGGVCVGWREGRQCPRCRRHPPAAHPCGALLHQVMRHRLPLGRCRNRPVTSLPPVPPRPLPPLPLPSQVVLAGLNIILPLISSELLKFPKLCHLYFSLLALMLEVYPRQVGGKGRGREGAAAALLQPQLCKRPR
jgi:hypothetical protein